jgi:hypothetical protein
MFWRWTIGHFGLFVARHPLAGSPSLYRALPRESCLFSLSDCGWPSVRAGQRRKLTKRLRSSLLDAFSLQNGLTKVNICLGVRLTT